MKNRKNQTRKSGRRFNRIPTLQLKIFLVIVAIVFILVALQTMVVKLSAEDYITRDGVSKVMHIAEEVSKDPVIIGAFSMTDPSAVIQPLAENIRAYTETSFIVVFNMNSVRYSHPIPEQLGKQFVGGDEKDALRGKQYVSRGLGTLGLSIRSFVPIKDNNTGTQIGVVSVGLLLTNLKQEVGVLDNVLYILAAVSLILGFLGAFLLSRNIKRTIFGLEPNEIAALLEERNVIISAIKEGIVAVDQSGRIILINDSAKELLGTKDAKEGHLVTDLIPNSKLPEVLRTGLASFDDEQLLDSRVVFSNRIPLVHQGEQIGAVATFRDLSELRSLTKELTEVKRYTEALRAQHHEFLNTLHVVSGLLQLGQYSEAVRFIVSTVSSQQKVFDDLRKLIGAPDVSALILAKMNEAHESGIEVHMDGKSRLEPLKAEVVASVVTIVGNLLQNSIEALRSTQLNPKRIGVFFGTTEQDLIIRIWDNGCLAPGLKEHIFERGVTTKMGNGNMGIGLHLVKINAERWKGTVELDDSQGVAWIVRLNREAVFG